MLDSEDLKNIKQLLLLLLDEIEDMHEDTIDRIENMKQDIDEFMQVYKYEKEHGEIEIRD